MWLRGVSVRDVGEAVQRETGLLQAMYRRHMAVYDERVYGELGVQKAFPVKVEVQ